MKTQHHIALIGTVLVVTSFAALSAGCAQQAPGCQVSNSLAYAGKYAQTAGATDAPCGGIKGDQLGFGSYNPVNKEGAPDLSKASLAIRSDRLGELVANADANGITDTTKGDAPFAFGDFKQAFPDANDLCEPKEMASAHQVLPLVPGDDGGTPDDATDDIPPQDPVDFSETWTGVQVFVTAAAEGTEVKGHYAIHDELAQCDAEYDVLALFPAVDCTSEDADGNTVGDDLLCSAVAIPEKGIAVGSGISPDVSTKCEDIGPAGSPQFFCLLDADPTTATLPVPKKQ